MTITMRSVLALLPPAPQGAAPNPLADPETAADALRKAGLEPEGNDSFVADLVFGDAETAVRALMSAGVTVRASRIAGEDVVTKTIRDTLGAVTRPDGSVAWRNVFRWLRARRPHA
jgi:hypothetical protein